MIATTVVRMEDPIALIKSMAIFLTTVVMGLMIHTLLTQPLIYFIFMRKNPYKHLLGCIKALVTAFATNNRLVTDFGTKNALEPFIID